jgi:DNA-binding SARP family transcriptional activator/Flp pilus assembly protein TadD
MPDSNGKVSLLLLGSLDLRSAQWQELRRVLSQPKRLVLLAYLTLAGSGRFRRRDTVISMFWPDLDQVRARAALRQSLSWLRRELGDHVLTSRGDEEIGVAGEALCCDAVLFDEACEAGLAERAFDLYRGEFLEGVFVAGAAPELEAWLDAERSRFRERAVGVAWALVQRESVAGRHTKAADLARRAIGLAPHDEEGIRRLIELLATAGNRSVALEEYARFCERLRTDFDAEPSAQTQGLVARLRGETTPLPPSPQAARAPATGVPAQRQRPAPAVPRIAVVFLAVLATGALAWRVMGPQDRTPGVSERASLVVGPLVNATGDSTLDQLASGMTASVTATLSRVAHLRVVRPTARDAGAEPDPGGAERAGETGLSFSWWLKRAHDSLEITTEIERKLDATRIASHHYRLPPGQLVPIQRAIVESLLADLGTGLGRRPPGNLARHPGTDVGAYLLLIKSEYYVGLRTRDGFRQARDLALQAIRRDPLYADAYAELGTCYVGFAWYGLMPANEAFLKSESAARRAVALDTTSALGHAVLGATLSFFRYQWTEGEAELRRAVALDPATAEIRNLYALHLREVGRFDEALDQMRQAQAMDPLFRHYFKTAGVILTWAGRDVEALAEIRKALELDSTYADGRNLLSGVLARLGRYDEALDQLRLTLELGGDHQFAATIATARGEGGYRNALRRLAALNRDRLRRQGEAGQEVRQGNLAEVLLALGDRDGAIAALERAFAVRDPMLIGLSRDPDWREIRGDPRVQALIRKMNLQ